MNSRLRRQQLEKDQSQPLEVVYMMNSLFYLTNNYGGML